MFTVVVKSRWVVWLFSWTKIQTIYFVVYNNYFCFIFRVFASFPTSTIVMAKWMKTLNLFLLGTMTQLEFSLITFPPLPEPKAKLQIFRFFESYLIYCCFKKHLPLLIRKANTLGFSWYFEWWNLSLAHDLSPMYPIFLSLYWIRTMF